MLQVLLIFAVMVVLLRDAAGVPPLYPWLGAGGAAGVTLGAYAVLGLITSVVVGVQSRLLERTGRYRAVARAERVLAASRVVAALIHAGGVLIVGWLDAVRAWMGNLVLVDELAALVPLLCVLLLGWWALYPIDRRLREAVLVRQLDEGRPVYPVPGRGAFVLQAARHQLALVLVPVVILMAWSEAVERAAAWMIRTRDVHLHLSRETALLLIPALQVSGLVVAFTLMPLVMRRVWDTVRLGPGPIRDSMTALCRAHRVGFRDLLVWRTHGSMINGAVMGLVGPVRYILLTDALLDNLTAPQVEAVTAHEVGHVRRRHMIWLALATGACAVVAAVGAGWVLEAGMGARAEDRWAEVTLTVLVLGVGALAFGFVSRRFEWQADAFAVQHLSGWRRGEGPLPILPEAVGAMSGALCAVSDLSHIPRDRFTWRHGSIRTRLDKLRALTGLPADRLPIDRAVRRLKLASLATMVVGAALVALDLSLR